MTAQKLFHSFTCYTLTRQCLDFVKFSELLNHNSNAILCLFFNAILYLISAF